MILSFIFVGLDYSITSNDLKEIFAAHGTVESASVINDKFTGKSKGFGFVDMSSQQEAEQCILMLNNSMQKSRQIIVKFKDDNAGKKPFGGNRSGSGSGRNFSTNRN